MWRQAWSSLVSSWPSICVSWSNETTRERKQKQPESETWLTILFLLQNRTEGDGRGRDVWDYWWERLQHLNLKCQRKRAVPWKCHLLFYFLLTDSIFYFMSFCYPSKTKIYEKNSIQGTTRDWTFWERVQDRWLSRNHFFFVMIMIWHSKP